MFLKSGIYYFRRNHLYVIRIAFSTLPDIIL